MIQHVAIVLSILTPCLGMAGGASLLAADGNLPGSPAVSKLRLGRGVRFVGRLETARYTSIQAVAVLPRGKLVAAATNWGDVHVWDSEKLKVVRKFSHFDSSPSRDGAQHGIGAVAFSRDGKYVCMENTSLAVSLWDVTTGRLVAKHAHVSAVLCAIAIHGDGKQVALAGLTYADDYRKLGIVTLWNWEKQTTVAIMPPNTERVVAVDYQPNGALLATNSLLLGEDPMNPGGWGLAVWNTSPVKLDHELPFDGFGDETCRFDPRGRYLAADCDVPNDDELAGTTPLRLWDVGMKQRYGDVPAGELFAFLPTLPAVVVSRESRKLLLINYTDSSARLLVKFRKNEELPRAVRLSADGKLMVVGTAAGTVYLFHLAAGTASKDR